MQEKTCWNILARVRPTKTVVFVTHDIGLRGKCSYSDSQFSVVMERASPGRIRRTSHKSA